MGGSKVVGLRVGPPLGQDYITHVLFLLCLLLQVMLPSDLAPALFPTQAFFLRIRFPVMVFPPSFLWGSLRCLAPTGASFSWSGPLPLWALWGGGVVQPTSTFFPPAVAGQAADPPAEVPKINFGQPSTTGLSRNSGLHAVVKIFEGAVRSWLKKKVFVRVLWDFTCRIFSPNWIKAGF